MVLKVRLEADKVCLLVMIGVRTDGESDPAGTDRITAVNRR
jgi:hypothetical protein